MKLNVVSRRIAQKKQGRNNGGGAEHHEEKSSSRGDGTICGTPCSNARRENGFLNLRDSCVSFSPGEAFENTETSASGATTETKRTHRHMPSAATGKPLLESRRYFDNKDDRC